MTEYSQADRIREMLAIYRLKTLQDWLYWRLRTSMNRDIEGPIIVRTSDHLYRAERAARAMVPFDPTGL